MQCIFKHVLLLKQPLDLSKKAEHASSKERIGTFTFYFPIFLNSLACLRSYIILVRKRYKTGLNRQYVSIKIFLDRLKTFLFLFT